jgi:hypothetical protein
MEQLIVVDPFINCSSSEQSWFAELDTPHSTDSVSRVEDTGPVVEVIAGDRKPRKWYFFALFGRLNIPGPDGVSVPSKETTALDERGNCDV